MERVTPTVFTDTTLRGCNPSFVVTSDGVVVIDTPQLPTRAVAMRAEAESHGPLRYLINTEHHVDHIFGNYFFRGACPVVEHRGVFDNFMVVTPDLDPYAYAREAIPTDDPEGAEIFPDRETYYADPNKGSIVFTGDLTLSVGDRTFRILHTPGHTPGQVAVHVPEDRVVFTGDTVFCECQTWLMTSNIDQWIAALDRIGSLDAGSRHPRSRPGHYARLSRGAALEPARLEGRRGGRGGEGLVAPGDDRTRQLRRPLSGRHRSGLHDGSHPDAQRRVVVGQVHDDSGWVNES